MYGAWLVHGDEWRSLSEGVLHLWHFHRVHCTPLGQCVNRCVGVCVYISLCYGTCISTRLNISRNRNKKEKQAVWQCETTQDLMYSSICAGGAISGNDGLSRADAAVLEWRGGRKGVEQWRAKKKSPVKCWKGDGNVLEWRKSSEWKSMSRHYNDTHKCVHINSERDIDAFKPKGTHTLILTKHMMMYSLHVEFLCLKCTRVCVCLWKEKLEKVLSATHRLCLVDST